MDIFSNVDVDGAENISSIYFNDDTFDCRQLSSKNVSVFSQDGLSKTVDISSLGELQNNNSYNLQLSPPKGSPTNSLEYDSETVQTL